ncbi:MAG: hypothetical protein IJ802_01635 [Kiritimatiellae bacterium]|nr:hypothetical protein [Kiritimatiellia bacterium]
MTPKGFWSSSLVMFIAMRSADAVNAFAGIWLVPKYISPDELGAVLPLSSFAGMLALPFGIFATVVMKQLASLARTGSYGEIKSLLRGTFAAAGCVFVLAIASTKLLFPAFLERLRIEAGSLSFLIVVAAFSSALAPVFSNSLLGLKRFGALAFYSFISAPARVIAMLLLMPLRAISGYFAGQAVPGAIMAAGAIFALRREMRTPPKPFWTRTRLCAIAPFAAAAAVFLSLQSFQSLLETTAVRQCMLPADSAAYYMVTRFSEIASYAGLTLSTVIFPFAASAPGAETLRTVRRAMMLSLAIGCALAAFFALAGKPILAILPGGELYQSYTPSLVALTIVATLSVTSLCGANALVAMDSFLFLFPWAALHTIYFACVWSISRWGSWTMPRFIAATAIFAAVKLLAISPFLRTLSRSRSGE